MNVYLLYVPCPHWKAKIWGLEYVVSSARTSEPVVDLGGVGSPDRREAHSGTTDRGMTRRTRRTRRTCLTAKIPADEAETRGELGTWDVTAKRQKSSGLRDWPSWYDGQGGICGVTAKLSVSLVCIKEGDCIQSY